MLPLRQRVACIARRAPRSGCRISRSYASQSHSSEAGRGPPPTVEESLGSTFYLSLAAVPAAMLVYSLATPGKDGEAPSLTKFIDSFSYLGEKWETRNTLRTAALEQAAHDRHLFYNVDRNQHIELKFPEVFQTGCPRNVPAGHSINLDKVVAHYRKQHLDEEDRKAKKLAQKSQE